MCPENPLSAQQEKPTLNSLNPLTATHEDFVMRPYVSHPIPNVPAAFLLLQPPKLAVAECTTLSPTAGPVRSSHLLKSGAFGVAPLGPLCHLLTLILEYIAL